MKRKSQEVEQPDDIMLEMQVVSELRDAKSNRIRKCAYAFEHANNQEEKNIALEELRKLSISEQGLVDGTLRKRCWPILLNVKAKLAEERKDGGIANLRFCNRWKCK